jgi:hypothetical protein
MLEVIVLELPWMQIVLRGMENVEDTELSYSFQSQR